ncbi:MAG: efflux RND transporter periplasmic adaptor subunit, partial [Verrucomicrobia bacterium]|nr:efflux RND transporter periplasmic adaptor subunit [Verrucomicrobiota bacterium]
MKKWIVLAVAAAAAAAAYHFAPWFKAIEAEGDVAQGPKTALVVETNIAFAVSAAGEITPAEQVSVRPEINGRIELLPVDVGDRVK